MRLRISLLSTLLVAGCASAPPPAQPSSSWAPATLPDAYQFDLASKQTGRTHRIFVGVPRSPAPAAGHPVLYVLDGNSHFATADRFARTLPRLARGFGVEATPPVIVGLGYPDPDGRDAQARGEDYTPPAPNLTNSGDRFSAREGGADRFLRFIGQELKPALAAQLRIDRSREAVMGHSYGGLLVLHALFTQPELFETYVAGSPSIWWNERFVLTERDQFLARHRRAPVRARVLLTVGSLEQQPRRSAGPRGTKIAERRMVDDTRELATALATASVHESPKARLEVRFLELAGEDHYSSSLPLMSRGILYFAAPALMPGAE